jgi:hypothetical protein
MPDAFRRFRQHPIYSTIGALFAILLIALGSLVWLGALVALARGRPLESSEWIALIAVSVLGGWYLNFMAVWHRLRRVDPQAYAWATKDMGFIAYVFSTRGAPTHLHHALAGLELDHYPVGFRFHVRLTLFLNATLLWICCAVALGVLAISLAKRR